MADRLSILPSIHNRLHVQMHSHSQLRSSRSSLRKRIRYSLSINSYFCTYSNFSWIVQSSLISRNSRHGSIAVNAQLILINTIGSCMYWNYAFVLNNCNWRLITVFWRKLEHVQLLWICSLQWINTSGTCMHRDYAFISNNECKCRSITVDMW